MKGKNKKIERSWKLSKFNLRISKKKEKQRALAVQQMSETKSLNGHRYKELLKSLVKKAKGSDLSVQKKELSESERNAAEADVHYIVETTDAESFFAQSKYERVDFVLRKIKYSGDGERSNSHVTQTTTEGSVEAELHVESTKDKIHESHCPGSRNESEKEDEKCSIRRHGGKLLCCTAQGCERSYYLSRVNPPLAYVPPTIWHCNGCVQKKLKLGVHAVSEGMESILDTKEVMSDDEVLQKQQQRQYLVKYKGLSHIHSLWIPERQLICENPALLAKYQKHKQKVHWKTDWLVPHRLLDKRSIPFSINFDSQVLNQDTNILDCRYEWLVKWTGLNYDKATWELENESFMRSPEAMKLVCDYESRHQKARRVTNSSKEDEERQNTFSALKGFLIGDSAGTCDRYFVQVKKLCDKWHKNQNALVIDDQEKIVKVVLFILSLQVKATQPFLIITRSTDISSWEAEFSRRASSANVIVYKGNTDVRTIIRTLEFYNKNGCVMFEVLIAPCVAIGEDFEMLGCISWDAIIVDDCQHPSILVQLRHIKMLRAGMRLLLVSGQIKERHCSSVLSLLDPQYGKIIEDCSDSLANQDMVKLKENLAQFVTYECKSTRNTFVEYWVPVRLSNVQTELYCGSLFSNSELLSSYLKHDLTEMLHDLLISTRKVWPSQEFRLPLASS